jgi:hypothetical protein
VVETHLKGGMDLTMRNRNMEEMNDMEGNDWNNQCDECDEQINSTTTIANEGMASVNTKPI